MEQLAVAGAEELHITETKKAMPGARKRLPGEVEEVTAALARLDAALLKVNTSLGILGEYQNCGMAYPLSDEELGNLLQAREEVWKVRTIAVLGFPMPTDDASLRQRVKAFPLMFEIKAAGPHAPFTHAIRTGPKLASAFPQSN